MGSDSLDKSGSLIHKDSNKRIRTGLGGGNLQGSLHKEFLDIGQPEVNMAWWQPPLSLDSWKPVNLVELGNDLGYIVEYKIEYSESIDTHTASSIDSNESPTTDENYPTSLNGSIPLTTSRYQISVIQTLPFNNPTKEDVMTIP
ncbi:hypothetical protein DY000_02030655 [Brassica cretica]|uniref:Agenet domain-containing protein n=1 Tax=Brassica cretica TaxID=69181 RepID=A0ABQ7DU75_BRACR|nr:hypothetical protein DY000_02030655 [Brassica cretica]